MGCCRGGERQAITVPENIKCKLQFQRGHVGVGRTWSLQLQSLNGDGVDELLRHVFGCLVLMWVPFVVGLFVFRLSWTLGLSRESGQSRRHSRTLSRLLVPVAA